MLESVGLDDHTEETYRHLVSRSPSSVTELVDLLGTGERRVRKALDALVSLGLAYPEAGGTGRFVAVDPQVG